MSISIQILCPDQEVEADPVEACVSSCEISVSKPHLQAAVQKVLEMLLTYRISCCTCPSFTYMLYPLSGGSGEIFNRPSKLEELREDYQLDLHCGGGKPLFSFEIAIGIVEKAARRVQDA
ncbi:MAG: hypothetical protein LBV27_08615 [Oscillospiraceae bacterium]|nr:hypothetical protein [Oscillospiraceae bacterium]